LRLVLTRHIPNMATAETAVSKQQIHFSRRRSSKRFKVSFHQAKTNLKIVQDAKNQ